MVKFTILEEAKDKLLLGRPALFKNAFIPRPVDVAQWVRAFALAEDLDLISPTWRFTTF